MRTRKLHSLVNDTKQGAVSGRNNPCAILPLTRSESVSRPGDTGANLIAKCKSSLFAPDLFFTRTALPDESPRVARPFRSTRSEEHTSELQSLMRNSYAVFCLKK